MVNNDTKLFYLSGLFSISFFLIIIFSTLYYSYTKDRVLKIRTDKKTIISVNLIEKPKIVVPKITPPKKIIPQKPKPKPIPKEIKPVKPKPVPEKKQTPKPIPKPETPSLGSLFAKVDTSKYKESEEIIEQKPRISDEMINRLKGKISKTEIPDNNRDENISDVDYKVERSYRYKNSKSVRVDYRELEIRNSSLDDADKGVYDKFYTQIKSFLYNKWYPSENIAGNSAIVRIILNEKSVLEHYKILTRGKSDDFNIELTHYLESIKGTIVSVDIKTKVSFEVKFRAKE